MAPRTLIFACVFVFFAVALAAGPLPASLADSPIFRLADGGILERSDNGGAHWRTVRGLPTRVLPEDRSGEPLPVTAIAQSPGDPTRILAGVGARLFVSTSSGASWKELDIAGTINRSTYITSLAADPGEPAKIAVGTSYDGIYITSDGGSTWEDLTADWQPAELYLGAGFFEEISALEFEPDGSLLVQTGFGSGFVSIDPVRKLATRLRPVTNSPQTYRAPSTATTGNHGEWSPAAAERVRAASNRVGIYVAAANATPEKLTGYFDLIEARGYDSIIVDFKDDLGRVTYDSELDLVAEVGSELPLVDAPALIFAAHERGIYVIARVVLFKDRELFRYDGNRLALWDSARNQPWGVFRTITDDESGEARTIQVEHWVDPNSPEVREYNIAIAREIAELGVDEIQFDYVRFPSDGSTDTIQSRYAPAGADRVQSLEAFLAGARTAIDLPISIDVFGFNAWSRMSYLGQDISRLSRYVDVISPMFYPSHFARSFLPAHTYMERSEVIYDAGTRRAREIAGTALIRPYVQAFLIGPELQMEAPQYHRYLEIQVGGLGAAAASGYSLWNASGRYYMLR